MRHNKDSKKTKDNKVPMREAWQRTWWAFMLWYKKYPMMFITDAVSEIVNVFTTFIDIYFTARIINELAGDRNPDELKKWVLITLTVTAAATLLRSILSRWHNYHNAGYYHKRCRFYSDKMLDMDFCSLDEQHTHDLRSQIMQNERWNGWGLNRIPGLFHSLVHAFLTLIGSITLSYSLFTLPVPESAGKFTILNSPWFVLAIGAVMLGVTFLSPFCQTKSSLYWTKQAENSKKGNRFFSFYGFMASDHTRAMDIRIYNQSGICSHYLNEVQTFGPRSTVAKFARGPMGLLNALSASIYLFFIGITYVFVCAKAWAGAFKVGSVTQYIMAISGLSDGIASFIGFFGQMKSNAFFLRDTYEYMSIPNAMYQGSLTTEKRTDRDYEIEFRDVSFHYPNSDTYALKHVNVKFKIGKRLAVVGQNGSGKTTFIKLLCRMYDPTEGVILLNGIDIRKYDYKDYMSIFAVVFQDFKLLAFTLGENVAASQDYDKDKALQCLQEAGFDKRLQDMPEGLDTYLYRQFDDKGVELSGGEAQKVALARALYKNAPFIVLDEPTAALDPVAEYEVYMKFNEIVQDKTAIYISHRLSSCRFCDDIVVFDEGSIVQYGEHEKLLTDSNGKYHELWHAQAQYYTNAE